MVESLRNQHFTYAKWHGRQKRADSDARIARMLTCPGYGTHMAIHTTLFPTTAYGGAMGKTAGNGKKNVTLSGANGTYLHNDYDGKHNEAQW